jgi:hypothetical protein
MPEPVATAQLDAATTASLVATTNSFTIGSGVVAVVAGAAVGTGFYLLAVRGMTGRLVVVP